MKLFRFWNYGVTYRKGEKLKDKHFVDFDDAHAFYKKCKHFDDSAIFFRFRKTLKIEQWFERTLKRLGLWRGK
jgi:hypothetical protein